MGLHRNSGIAALAAVIGALVAGSIGGHAAIQRFNALQHEAIRYYRTPPDDSITRLDERIEAGEVELVRDSKDDYLASLLDALDIDVSSQILVSSKTSLQISLITPDTPRAIYFNDDTYIAWVQGSPFIEISTVDPKLGAVFYTLDQTPGSAARFERDFDVCMQCHNPNAPGHVMTSTIPDETGTPMFHAGTFVTSDRSPIEERWGGWYVTGNHGNQFHMGNLILRDLPPTPPGINTQRVELDRESGANVTDLSGFFNAEPYLSAESDIVALMAMGHQVFVQNLMTKLNYAIRKSRVDRPGVDPLEGNEDLAEEFVDAMLLVGEARLTSRVSGTSGFTEDFESRGPRDSRGRSLHELDLSRRLFRYPLSYLIYSRAFAQLPAPGRDFVLNRIEEVLSGQDRSERFDHLSAVDRRDVREILVETMPDYAAVARQR